MKLNKAFKYRIYPNKEQEILIQKTFGCCRFIYNIMLADKIAYYKETGKSLSNTPAQYKDEFKFLKEVDSQALANEQMHLQSAYKNFFRDKKVGFPKFKSKKHDIDTYTTAYVNVVEEKLKLGKLGFVKMVYHRQIPDLYKIKSATISQKPSGKYYVSILTEYEFDKPIIEINTSLSIGLDYSSPDFYIDNLGRSPSASHFFREMEQRLAKEQRKLSNMKYGSNNYSKQKIKVAKVHEKIENMRKDFIEKLSFSLSNEYDIVCVEDIDMKSISRSLHLGKSTMDNGFGMFRIRLQQKLEERGKVFVKIDRFFPSSKTCSECGAYHKDIVKDLSVREWVCPDCGTLHNRDINAAKNILAEGLRIIDKTG